MATISRIKTMRAGRPLQCTITPGFRSTFTLARSTYITQGPILQALQKRSLITDFRPTRRMVTMRKHSRQQVFYPRRAYEECETRGGIEWLCPQASTERAFKFGPKDVGRALLLILPNFVACSVVYACFLGVKFRLRGSFLHENVCKSMQSSEDEKD
jgi:hypothetical protein